MTAANSFIILEYDIVLDASIQQMARRLASIRWCMIDQSWHRPIHHLLFDLIPSTKESAQIHQLLILLLY